ncbi:SacI domain protein [Talaromyces stipitatus ATCC 10500]|uniref:SacI domain protein n=1 Tax=Talaromyces stipitatus (strain ATCC 10500 / CBS 375.48 / QM 6759 / NRRL 1006) TaxID=441959 RepID=B8M1Z6_TALSN|nr:SacI domain protein [Talaromyces stipitatus ATCC 10500]EED21374.1 SacI domain protein [Talaromyces stipitatus ATCC 10500]
MPSLVRKFVIFATVDGLILQQNDRGQRNSINSNLSVQIDYKTRSITSLSQASSEESNGKLTSPYLEAYGLVGLLNIASSSFLIPITQRKEVAQISGKPIYAVTNVAIIPLSSQDDANRAIIQAQKISKQGGEESDQASTSELSGSETDSGDEGVIATPAVSADTQEELSKSGVAQDVIGNKGRNSRFALDWFSRKRWGAPGTSRGSQSDPTPFDTEKANVQCPSKREPLSPESDEVSTEAEAAPVVEKAAEEVESESRLTSSKALELMPKLLRYTKLIFASNNFFFSYDYDLTRRYSGQDPRAAHLPLHVLADRLPFIDSGDTARSFVLPLIQGFVGQREFTVASVKNHAESLEDVEDPEEGLPPPATVVKEETRSETLAEDSREQNFLLTLISRRSIQRPGLRYLRRGVDDEGNTANTVETEQILSTPGWDPSRKVYSLIQVRGSIPLYFTQSPYSLKPIPVLHHTYETNRLAFARHFRDLARRYGKVQIVSLVDRHGVELNIGEAYEAYTRDFNENQTSGDLKLGFEWFDFHHECRGMKFENVKYLVDKLVDTSMDFGETIILGNRVLKDQTGVIRTNCMDCLDRTGVAQCAFGQRSLEQALKSEGYTIDLLGDASTQWFNTLWADNGDAISKQYSSTAALKGDYTRTRKRNYRGALNDFGLTLSRYFNNIVNDYFSQACIDYLLGNVSIQVFSEFQDNLKTIDPGISITKLRQNAIETCSKLVVDNHVEELVGGWAMLSPRQPNTLRTFPFEETVLLLTDAALYNCRFDWNTDKVLSFERITLSDIRHIHYGTYITSVLTDAQTDEEHNVGMVIIYQASDSSAFRVNTRSLQSSFSQDLQDTSERKEEWNLYSWLSGTKRTSLRLMAFKALATSTSATVNNTSSDAAISEKVAIQSICEEIERAIKVAQRAEDGDESNSQSIIEEKDIISLAEAKKRTGYLEQLVYDVKKLVWA